MTLPSAQVKGRLATQKNPATASPFTILMSDPFTGDAVEVGDFVFLYVQSSGSLATSNTPLLPAGFTELIPWQAMGTSTTTNWALYVKRRTVGETNYTISQAQTDRTNTIGILVFWIDGDNTREPAEWIVGAIRSRATSGGGFVNVAPSITTTSPDSMAFSFSAERTTASEVESGFTVTGTGWTKQITILGQLAASATMTIGSKPMVSPGATGDATTTAPNTQSANGAALQIAIPSPASTSAITVVTGQATEADTALPVTRLVRATQALPGTDRLRAAVLSTNATSVRLAVSTSSGMTSPVYGSAQVPDAQGYSKHEVTGLSAGTDYWWRIELDGVLTGPVGRGRTLPAAGAASFSFLAASCAVTGSSNAVFTAMRDRTGPGGRRPLFFAHMGDVHYAHSGGGSAPNDVTDHRANYESALQSSTQAPLYRDVPLSHSWSDNDFCGSNSDSTYVGRPAAITARRQLLADPPLPDTGGNGLWTSWVVGRVRFIRTDSRTYMSNKAATDDAAKSMLGAEQKAWLKEQLAAPQPLKVWFHDMAWGEPPATPGAVDDWRVFSTERAEIAAHIAAVEARVLYVHGDQHRLSADDGTNNAYGGFPVIGAAPIDQQASSTWPWVAQQAYPTSGTISSAQLYGWFDVADTGGDVITVDFVGYDGGGVQRISMTTVVPVGLGQATEADVALPAGRRKARTVGQATETDVALPAGRRKTRTVGQATETDTGQPASRRKTRTVGQATETDVGQPAGRWKTRTGGQATEADTGQPAGRVKLVLLGLAAELDLALSLTIPGEISLLTGQATEGQTALPTGRQKIRATGQAAEADLAQPATRQRSRTAGQAAEVDVAAAADRVKRRTLGQPADTSTAATVVRVKTRSAGPALELSTALPVLGGGGTDGVTLWDGAAELPVTVTWWDGATERPVTVTVA